MTFDTTYKDCDCECTSDALYCCEISIRCFGDEPKSGSISLTIKAKTRAYTHTRIYKRMKSVEKREEDELFRKIEEGEE